MGHQVYQLGCAHVGDGSRIASLDGWRAVAILIVLVEHSRNTRGFPDWANSTFEVLWQGAFGVRTFFVISGYLITYLLVREWQTFGRIDLKLFYARRIIRIFPVYFLYVGVLAALAAFGFYHESPESWLGSVFFVRNYIGRGDSANVHLWSLSVEEQFYVFWPTLLALVGILSRRYLAWALVAGWITLSIATHAVECASPYGVCARLTGGKSLLYNADALGIGCGLAILRARGVRPAARLLAPIVLAAVAAILALGFARQVWEFGLLEPAMPAVTMVLLGAAIYATTFLRTGPLFAALNNPPIRRIGTWSYSIYIWHFAFLHTFSQMTFADTSVIFDWRIWWIPALVAGIVSYELFEAPILQLREKFRPKWVHSQAARNSKAAVAIQESRD